MKKSISLMLICASCLLSFQARAQMKVITLDFASKSFAKDCEQLKNLKSGEMYQLRIININMNLYNVSINKTDSFIVHDVPFPTLEMIGSARINSLLESLKFSSNSIQNNPSLKAKNSLVEEFVAENAKLASINYALDKTENDLSAKRFERLDNKSRENFTDDSDTLQLHTEISELESQRVLLEFMREEQMDLINHLTQEIEAFEARIKAEAATYQVRERILIQQENHKLTIKSLLNQSKTPINDADSLICKLNNQVLAYLISSDKAIPLSQYVFDPNLTFDIAVQSAQNYRNQIESIRKSISSEQNAYTAYMEGLLANDTANDMIKKDTLIKLNHSRIMESFTKSLADLSAAADKISFVKISAFFNSLIHLENNQDRTYTTLPMQLNGDINKMTVNITPKVTTSGLQSFNATYLFPRKTFYVGLGASFYHANFLNQVYSLRETKTSDTTSNFNFVDEEPGNSELGFASLLHFGWKLRCSKPGLDGLFGFHGTMGPAISLSSEPQFRMAAGVGFSIGKRNNMLTFDYLGMGGYVNQLSKLYQENGTYEYKPEQYMVSKLQFAGAMSLGYIYRF